MLLFQHRRWRKKLKQMKHFDLEMTLVDILSILD